MNRAGPLHIILPQLRMALTMNQNINKILVLAPHTDDGEFGCGGSIAKFTMDGKNVFYAAFSTAEKSVPDHLPKTYWKSK